MLHRIKEFIEEKNINIYDIAVMTDQGNFSAYCQPCNACNAGYSVTKLFIVTMIGILYDNNLLGLEDKITEILADELTFFYDPCWDQVSLRHALTHTMGLDYGIIDIDRDDTGNYKLNNYLEYIFSYPPVYPAGSKRVYTDVPHYLLSLVIEKITGKRADEVITEKILTPLSFASSAWARCPMNHTIGSSGSYMTARDMVKLAWLYQNYGEYHGIPVISREWAELVQREQYDLYPLNRSDFYGKSGLNGQMVMFSREKGISVAWHGYELGQKDMELIDFFDHLDKF